MNVVPERTDGFGLVKPAVDAHTLGINSVEQLLEDCGYRCVIGDAAACDAFGHPEDPRAVAAMEKWIRDNRVSFLGFSYRLDPRQGAATFGEVVHALRCRGLLMHQGGQIKGLYFAGLPEACSRVKQQNPELSGVFCGDETPAKTLTILGINPSALPNDFAKGTAYDDARLSFGRDLIAKGKHLGVRPVDRSGYDGFGAAEDSVVARIRSSIQRGQPPLFRAHVGPYLPDRAEAVQLFEHWARTLAQSGFLDILSIGTSQLTQSNFGEDWQGKPNGGGVPLNSQEEFAEIWRAARPMLVRTYAGTKNIPALARMCEETIHIAWHALSLWWFCRIDGRGQHTVRENLQQHLETLRYIATTGKPFEANVSHHFAFRGADDATYIVSAVLAARTAKLLGIRHFILQNMLNTPKSTWGVQDLAKSRALLQLARELEDRRFRVILQPRAGLDYFSPDLDKAKAQLAAATALMDDVEPRDATSPPIIHVVSYCEASHLADPPVVDESIQITRHALEQYRRLRANGQIDDMTAHPEVVRRTEELLAEARAVLRAIDAAVPNACTAEGLYRVFAQGFLPVPYLWECRDEFAGATQWQTRLVRGSVKIVDDQGQPMPAGLRMARIAATIPVLS